MFSIKEHTTNGSSIPNVSLRIPVFEKILNLSYALKIPLMSIYEDLKFLKGLLFHHTPIKGE